MLVELGRPASGQEREHGLRQAELELLARLASRRCGRGVLRQRVPDEGDRDSGRLVDRRFEREQRENPVDGAPDLCHSLASPRPHRRTDEVHGARTVALQLALEREIEIGRVDADEHRHAFGKQSARQRATDGEDLGQPGEDLRDAAHGERLERVPCLAPGLLHFRSRDADETSTRYPRTYRLDQHRRQRISRRLACDDSDRDGTGVRGVTHRRLQIAVQRTMPRSDATRNSTSGLMTGVAGAVAASAALASSSVRPSRYSVL